MEALRLEKLSKFYTSDSGVVVGLKGVSLSFSVGEFVALTGESGSGKSTLAHVLSGMLSYESGEMYINGKPTSHYDANDWSKYRRDMISFISQSYGILPGNTVSENIESALRFSGLSKEEAALRRDAILREVELLDFKNRKAGKLSSGQKQRLSIAHALAKPSNILIADEPTGNLDRENSEKIIALLKRASKNKLVILITHEFEEAKDVATRRIVLSDGEVITDAPLGNSAAKGAEETLFKPSATKPKQKGLTAYTWWLSVKSHPIFTAVLCLLLVATTFITFVFLGNFIIALDDTPTRIYDSSVFFNGTTNRLIVMRSDGAPLTDEDYQSFLKMPHTEVVEQFGAINDLIYYYKVNVDHTFHNQFVPGPNYDEMLNPDDYTIESKLELYDRGYKYLQTLPLSDLATITAGRKTESVYEVVSADPDYKVGDTVTIYIKHPNLWNIDGYLSLDMQVVGETNYGDGLYIANDLADMLLTSPVPHDTLAPYTSWKMGYVFLPYDKEDYEFIFSVNRGSTPLEIGSTFRVENAQGDKYVLKCKELHNASLGRLVLVSQNTFQNLLTKHSTQASVYLKDYSYTERAINLLKAEGYITISPYQLGSTEIDEGLKNERVLTLGICAVTFAVAMILQCILLFTMFNSLNEYYKLMANTGLTAGIALGTVSMFMLLVTWLGEAIGAAIIFLLNGLGVKRVYDIFKYLDTWLLVVLFVLHFALVLTALLFILWRTKKHVFGRAKINYDIDVTLMEEDAL